MQTLAIFDFDGTITTKDSFEDFILFSNGWLKTIGGLLQEIPALLGYLFGSMSNSKAKEEIFSRFYKGWTEAQFNLLAHRYAAEKLPNILRSKAMAQIAWHKREGHKIIVVSASFENYLKVWCDNHDVGLLATGIEIKEGKLTGNFSTKNCHGEEKINRIKAAYNLADFEFVYAYGDTKGDLALKAIANEFSYKPFRNYFLRINSSVE